VRIEARFGDDERDIMIEVDEWHPEAEIQPWLAAFERLVVHVSRRPGVVRMPGQGMTGGMPGRAMMGDPVLDDPALDPQGGTGERR